METIHGAELILLSFPEQHEGEYVGGLLTIATPMGKNWHWLRAEEYVNVDDLLASALGYAMCVGIDRVKVVEGFVANCAQEVEKGQLSLSVEGLSSQGVEQFGRSEAFFSSLHDHLSFLDHVHEFDPG